MAGSGKKPPQKNAKGDWPTVLNDPDAGKTETRPPLEDDPERNNKTMLRAPLADDTERGKKTEMRPGLADDTERGQKTELRPPLGDETLRNKKKPFTEESVETLRPQKPPDTLKSELDSDANKPQLKINTDPVKQQLRTFVLPPGHMPEAPKPPLLDKRSRLIVGGAVVGTFLLGAILWKVASPAPPPPPPQLSGKVPKGFSDAVRPAYSDPEPAPAAKEHKIVFEDVLDAGNGTTRSVKVEGGTIQILSVPDVTLSRNGAELGKTPITVTLPAGQVTLQVVNKAEGLSRNVTLEVKPGAGQSTKLEFYRGHIEVRAPAGTTVSLDGRPMGKTPMTVPLSAWPGTHTVDVVFKGGDKDSRQVQVTAGDNATLDFEAPVRDVRLDE